ncbi:hypothetical protein [Streptomyces sp. NPDC048641]|uniref:hypothetical protein n=1 Tax=Streptomyces sp. NPDC048641 TaxID=3154825 RepID=UPI00341D0A70
MTDTKELTVRPRTDADLPCCVEVLAGVQAAGCRPVDRPADPESRLTPLGMTEARSSWRAPTSSDTWRSPRQDLPWHRPPDCPRHTWWPWRASSSAPAAPARSGPLLLDRAIETGAARERTAVLEVETAASAAIGLYERLGRRHAGTSTADWTTADGRLARMRTYVAPPTSVNSSRPAHF